MKKFLSILLAVVMVLALAMPALAETKAQRSDLKITQAQPEQQAQADTAKLRGASSWDFETDPAESGFTYIDQDGDGFNWVWHQNTGTGNYTTHSGDGVMTSASYDNDNQAALTPDNWMISPVCEGTMLTFWMCGQDASYCEEYVGVYVSTDGDTTWSNEIAGFTATSEMTQQAVNLSAYTGEIQFALRHYNCTDMFYLDIDDIELMSEVPQCTVTFVDGYDGTTIDTMTVEAGTVLNERDFPTPPTHEGYEFTGWDYTGASIAADTTITANYKQEGSNLWDFETDPAAQGFTFEDQDGDGYNWTRIGQSSYAHESTYCMYSASWSSNALTPDNWMITPAFEAVGLSFWTRGNSYPDHIGVFVSTDGGATWSDKALLEYDTDGTEYEKKTVDLSAYKGQEIKVAFRHYNCTDQYYVFIDDIETYNTAPEYTVTFYDIMDESVLGTMTVEQGYVLAEEDFPEIPEHEGYVFYGWSYDGTGIAEDTAIIAFYSYDGVYENTLWDFEDEIHPIVTGFHTEDGNGDGNTWEWFNAPDYANSTSHMMACLSNGMDSMDDWLITPKFTGTLLTFYYRGYSSSYTDHLEVYASSDDGATWKLLEEFDVTGDTYAQKSIDLSEYTGTLRVGFCSSSAGGAYAFIDDIQVMSEIPTYTVTFIDGVTGEELERPLTVNQGYVLEERDFPTPPTHEDYTFTGWDYDGSPITADITVTAQYSYDKILIWDFETDPFENGFILLDADGDNSNWTWMNNGGSSCYEGSGYMRDVYKTDPDDYLITPAFKFNSDICTLSFWAQSGSNNWVEYLGVYVSTDNGTTWSNEIWGQQLTNTTPQEFTVDLSAYMRNDAIRVAFRHYNSPDQLYIYLDYVTLTDATIVAMDCEVTFVDGFNGETISTITVPEGTVLAESDFPIPPTHENYEFTGWDYDDSAIYGNTTITAIYSFAGVYSDTIWDFETDPVSQGFMMLDEDGDSHNWEWREPGASYVHSTSHSMYSASYEGGVGSLTPDNWLITPKFTGTLLTFWTRNYSSSYKDHIDVYVSADNGATWSESVLSIDPANSFEQYSIDLSAYGDAELRVAFRHWNCTNKYYLYIDDIEVMSVAPTYTVTFVDGVTNETIGDPLTVDQGYVLTEDDFPTPPEHEDWTFRNWDYDGSAISKDITVTAKYVYDKLLIWDFETSPTEQGFEMIDKDGDNKTWQWTTSSNHNHHEGSGFVEDNYKTAEGMDDWLITPFFMIDAASGSMSFWANCNSTSYHEKIGVYVSTDGGETWSDELYHLTTEGDTPTEYTVDLSAYAGQVIRVGFRHYESVNQYYAIIDYITVMDGVQVYPHNVTFKVGSATLATLENVLEITEEDLPEGPAWYGFTFTGWDMTVEEINAALEEGDVTVNGVFVPAENAFTVTVIYGNEVTEKTFTESRWLTVKAKAELNGQYFQYWTMDDVIISYSPRANVRVVDTCTLEAHYADEPIEATGVAQLIKATFAGGRETFVVYLAAPNGATMTDAGLLAAPGTEYDPDTAELNETNAKFIKHCNINDPSQPATYTWIKTNVAEGDAWYIRPFVSYELDGETFTVYGETTGVKAGNE